MRDFLDSLLLRTLDTGGVVQPRLSSLFEPPQVTHDLGLNPAPVAAPPSPTPPPPDAEEGLTHTKAAAPPPFHRDADEPARQLRAQTSARPTTMPRRAEAPPRPPLETGVPQIGDEKTSPDASAARGAPRDAARDAGRVPPFAEAERVAPRTTVEGIITRATQPTPAVRVRADASAVASREAHAADLSDRERDHLPPPAPRRPAGDCRPALITAQEIAPVSEPSHGARVAEPSHGGRAMDSSHGGRFVESPDGGRVATPPVSPRSFAGRVVAKEIVTGSVAPGPAPRPFTATRRGERRDSAVARPRPAAEAPAASPAPVVQVTIGRIEVRAAPPAESPRGEPRGRSQPLTGLDEYLKRRAGGGT